MKRPNKPMETDGRCAPAAHRQGVEPAANGDNGAHGAVTRPFNIQKEERG